MKTVINKKTILLAISFALVLSLSVGMAFAYFSDHTAAKGGASITLGGNTDIHEVVEDNSKTISIENTGETDVVVRVGIYGPSTMTVTDVEGSGWEYDEDTGFWYYDQVLTPQSSTSEITATVKAPKDQVEDFDVVVVHESAQVTYDENGKIKVPEGWVDVFNKSGEED